MKTKAELDFGYLILVTKKLPVLTEAKNAI